MKPSSALLVALALGGIFVATSAFASMQLHSKAGCVACHAVDKKFVGPSYKDIAARYKGRADAVAYLSSRVRKGAVGNWGTVPMAPIDVKKLSDAELKTLMTWLLATP